MIKKNTQISEDLFYEKCTEHSLKITPQRVIIFNELARATDHPSANVLYKRVRKKLPNISFDTVYRTLLSYTEIGIVSLVEGYGEQKRFEPNLDKHHHFRCIKCSTIIDFTDESYDEITVPAEMQKQCIVLNKRVVLEGICFKCQGK